MGERRREAIFQPEFLKDLNYWIRNDRKNAARVLDIVLDVLRDPLLRAGKARAAQISRAGHLVEAART